MPFTSKHTVRGPFTIETPPLMSESMRPFGFLLYGSYGISGKRPILRIVMTAPVSIIVFRNCIPFMRTGRRGEPTTRPMRRTGNIAGPWLCIGPASSSFPGSDLVGFVPVGVEEAP